MGYGEGSFYSGDGGGGYDDGGWNGDNSGWSGGGDNDSGGSADSDDCSKENRTTLYIVLAFNVLVYATVGAVLLPLLSTWDTHICGSIIDLNCGEQRICRTTKSEDLLFSTAATNVRAYRYTTKNMPPTETRIIQSSHKALARRKGYLYFDFALSAGGTVNFSYKFGYDNLPEVADLYLMTPAQFDAFQRRHKTTSLWARTDVQSAEASYTAESAGVYFFVVDNDSDNNVHVKQSANITTSVFQVSDTTATQVCSHNCTLKRVHSDETVVVEYTGPRLYVDAAVYQGTKTLPTGSLIGTIVLSLLAALLLAVLVVLIKQRRTSKSAPAVVAPAETTTAGTESSTPQEMTPEHDLTQPLVINTADEPVYYGTAPPPDYV